MKFGVQSMNPNDFGDHKTFRFAPLQVKVFAYPVEYLHVVIFNLLQMFKFPSR